MDYSLVSECYSKLEETSARNELTTTLASLLTLTPKRELPMLVYLTQGKLRPDYEGVELGLAEKTALKVMSTVTGRPLDAVRRAYVKAGDIGSAAEELLSTKAQETLVSSKPLTLEEVYNTLLTISRQSGEGSADAKQRELVKLLNSATPREARYIMRTVTGQLRLGVADYTVLDASAEAFLGGKAQRSHLERAYNIHPDMGYVVQTIAEKGLKGIENMKVQVGVPIRPMLAERLESAKAIVEKLGNREVAAEYKLDGERLQIHKEGETVKLFSRRLEVISSHYPDAGDLVRKNVRAKRAILEAEVVAVNEETGEYLPFQELMHRRRKYGIEEAMRQYPVALNFFDLLLAGEKDYTVEAYRARRKKLQDSVAETERTRSVPALRTDDPAKIEAFMEEAISSGCEGLVVKDLDSPYRAGAREFAWIKLKREYRSELTDTIDLVVIGAFHGKGRRAGAYGTYLLAAYDGERDIFTSIAKVGTGFSDEDLEKIPRLLNPYASKVRPTNVESRMEPDDWFRPHIVLEIIAAELTLSPIHTAGMGKVREGAGISLRFPKFTGKVRDDKKAEEATTVGEILEMYRGQIRKIAE